MKGGLVLHGVLVGPGVDKQQQVFDVAGTSVGDLTTLYKDNYTSPIGLVNRTLRRRGRLWVEVEVTVSPQVYRRAWDHLYFCTGGAVTSSRRCVDVDLVTAEIRQVGLTLFGVHPQYRVRLGALPW